RLRLDGLRACRLSDGEVGEAGFVGERRTSRCFFNNCAQGPGRGQGTTIGGKAEGSDPPSALSGSDSGGDRRQNHRARKRFGVTQERDREMLRRRYHAKTKTAGKAERRKETDEKHWPHQHSAGSLY